MSTDQPTVALISPEYPPVPGGVGDYTSCLAAALVRAGARVYVISTLARPSTGADYPGAGCADSEEAARVMVRRAIPRWDWSCWGSLERLLREIRADVAVIQYQTAAYGLHGAINLFPRWLKRNAANPPVVTTFHDLLVPFLFKGAGRLRPEANRELMRGSRALVVTNPADMAALPLSAAARARAIPIGANVVPHPPAGWTRDEWRAGHGIALDTRLIAYFGFLNSSKGLDTLVEALPLLPEGYAVLIVGGETGQSDATNSETASAIRNLIADRKLDARVHWTGYLKPDGVSAALLSSDVAALPFRDGASFRRGSLLAALSHRLPVVTTRPQAAPALGGWPELRDGQNALLVEPGDPSVLAAAINRVGEDAALRDTLSAGAASLADWFGWDAIAARYLALFASISNPSGSGALV